MGNKKDGNELCKIFFKKMQPPIRIMAPGRVYRNDYDQTHTPMFHQIELLYVDKKANFTELKGLLHDFLTCIF